MAQIGKILNWPKVLKCQQYFCTAKFLFTLSALGPIHIFPQRIINPRGVGGLLGIMALQGKAKHRLNLHNAH